MKKRNIIGLLAIVLLSALSLSFASYRQTPKEKAVTASISSHSIEVASLEPMNFDFVFDVAFVGYAFEAKSFELPYTLGTSDVKTRKAATGIRWYDTANRPKLCDQSNT